MSECRICRETSNESDNPLISPCNCIGTTGKVHRNCVEQWVQTSNHTQCNVCNGVFTQHIEYNGPLSPSLVVYLTSKERTLSTLLGVGSVLFTTGVLYRAAFRTVWNYFISSPLTFTRLAVYNTFSYSIFTIIGFIVGVFRQFTFNYGGQEYQLDGTTLILPISNIFAVIEFILATHHITYTGWVLPVILMYYMSLYKLVSTIIFDDFLGWYRKQYFKRVFTDNPELSR